MSLSFMSLYTRACSQLFFPLHEKLKKHDSVKVRERLEKLQWMSRSELDDYQLKQLKTFLTKIKHNVPFYHQLFKERDFDPQALTSLSQLSQLPLLTKEVIRQNRDDLISTQASDLKRFNTGGSTGEPLIFFLGKERISHDVAAKWRATRWWDVDIGSKEIVLWGSPIEIGSQDRVRQIRDKVLRSRLLSAFSMSQEDIKHYLSVIATYNPEMLFGYPSAIYKLAQFIKDQGQPMSFSNLKVIFVTSERLYDHQRTLIEDMFNCKVANGYGGRDSGFIAHECPQGSMHISSEDIIVEIVDKSGQPVANGEQGQIVVTHMATSDFPFVRYETGDVGILSDKLCSCGRHSYLLESIDGRTTDFIATPSGNEMHGLSLIYAIREFEEITNFKITQEQVDALDIQVMSSQTLPQDMLTKLLDSIKKILREPMQVDLKQVNHIEAEKNGKFRHIVRRF